MFEAEIIQNILVLKHNFSFVGTLGLCRPVDDDEVMKASEGRPHGRPLFSETASPVDLASSADSDPGLVFGCGYQLRSDLHDLSLQLLKLQLPHQRAEQDSCNRVGKPFRQNTRSSHVCRVAQHEMSFT